jgi:ATP-dependent protease Clp ATPase subunit
VRREYRLAARLILATLPAMVDRACTFCGSAEADVPALVTGPGVAICDSCVAYAGSVVTPSRPGSTPSPLGCSFCERRPDQTGRLVAGPDVRICEFCLRHCADVLAGRA